MSKRAELIVLKAKLNIVKAELQLNKDRLDELESEREQVIKVLGLEIIEDDDDDDDDDWNGDEHVMFDVRPGLWNEIKLASKAEGDQAEDEGIDYFCARLLETWCLAHNIEFKSE